MPIDACCQLHVHSSHSFKDGLAPEADLVARAAELGQPGIGLTNHGNLFGTPALFKACADADIVGVIGMEIYEAIPHRIDPELEMLAKAKEAAKNFAHFDESEIARFKRKYNQAAPRYHHLTLWAMNLTGWENLCTLHTLSYTEIYKPKYQPLIDRASLEAHSEGLIVGLGCPASRTNWTLAAEGLDAAIQAARWYFDVFGDRVYIEVMGNLPDQQAALRSQRKLATHFGRPTLAVNDVHYVRQEDGVEHGAHHTLVQARKFKSSATTEETSDDKSDDSYGSWYGSDEFYLKSRDQMIQTGMMVPEVDATLEVLDRIDFDFLEMPEPDKPEADVPNPGEEPEFDLWLQAA